MTPPDPKAGTLFLVSTPIGNLGDITHRAVQTLSSVTLIVAEDTRHSRRLLDHYGISTPLSSYHEHNEAKETPRLVARLCAGDSIALISDAGTPLISDPGSRLVAAAIEAGVKVVPIPGASSVMAALVASGMPLEKFTFLGFLPRKGRERNEMISAIISSTATTVIFEAPGRVAATLKALDDAGGGDRQAVIARELTKQYEEMKRGTIADLSKASVDAAPRGEVVIVISPARPLEISEAEVKSAATELRAEGQSSREVMEHLVSRLGAPRNLAYRIAHEGDS